MVFLLLTFKLTLIFFILSSRLFRSQIASVSCCVFFLCILSFFGVSEFDPDVHFYFLISNVHSVSSLDKPFRYLEQRLK